MSSGSWALEPDGPGSWKLGGCDPGSWTVVLVGSLSRGRVIESGSGSLEVWSSGLEVWSSGLEVWSGLGFSVLLHILLGLPVTLYHLGMS